jgi:hypothetical protein
MTKQEALQKFASHVDLSGVMDDFPEIDWVITELDDGQQEIVIRLQGIDVDFHPAGDLAVIDSTLMADIPNAIKNTITLRKHKIIATRERLDRRDNAWLKRINGMRIEMGMSVKRCVRLIESKIPARVREDE